jgi:hypothetical protein
MTCDECASTADVRLYDDPENDGQVALCEPCAAQILGDDEDSPYEATEENYDDEFADTCITAADYYLEGDY